MPEDPTSRRYLTGDYLRDNPTWDLEDSRWKADQILAFLRRHRLAGPRIVEVGCGAGGVLAALARAMPDAQLQGFDIAPDAARFWPSHREPNLRLEVGDLLAREDGGTYDLALVLDVVEHVADPFAFLTRLRPRAHHHVFHFPLDLSAASVWRGQPLLHVRRKVGHLHYFTKDLVLSLLSECGYEVVDWTYTGAAFAAPQRTWKTRLAGVPRRIAYALGKDAGVRLLGGETLLLLTRSTQRPVPG